MLLPDPYVRPTLSPAEVAEILDLHVDSVRKGCADGSIPTFAGRGLEIRSKAYRVPTSWLYREMGLDMPTRQAVA